MGKHQQTLRRLAIVACLASLPSAEAQPHAEWRAGLRVRAPEVAAAGRSGYRSSSRLEVEFAPATGRVDHYRVTARPRIAGLPTVSSVDAESAVVSGLMSDTAYSIDVTACHDTECVRRTSPADGPAFAQTEEEVWQIQASGDSIASATRVVTDGNVKVHAIRLGPEAPAEVAGRLQLYYGPLTQAHKGLAVAVSDAQATLDPASVSRFRSLAGVSGLLSPPRPAALVAEVNTGQAVPLADGVVRLLFEARGADGRTRILHIDSKDGYAGRDFNAGPSSVCSTDADYASGGPCAPSVDVAVMGDADGNPGFTDARQFKVAYPALDDWRWRVGAGTFMVLTVTTTPGCSTSPRTSAYALHDGARWRVQYRTASCPKLFENIQAPMPLHAGGGRYKMYFGNPSEQAGMIPGSRLPFLGPKRLAYADAAATGDPSVVEFEDWEPLSQARDVRFVWPSGRALSDSEEGYLDDFVMLMPTGDPALQVMYTGMTEGSNPPFVAMAVLLNP